MEYNILTSFFLTKRWMNVLKLPLIQFLSYLFEIQQKPRDRVRFDKKVKKLNLEHRWKNYSKSNKKCLSL